MAKGIYKQKGSNLYWIRYAGADGKIIRESAKTDNFKQAQAKLENQRKAIRDGKEPEPIKKIPIFTFNQLAAEYTKWCERQRGYRTKKNCISQLQEPFGNLQLRYINTKLVEQFQSDRITKNKPATVNRLIATLKHMMNKGYQWEMLSEETLKRVRQVQLLEENNRRLRYLSKEECKALLDTCSGHSKDIVIFALNTGCRKSEILSLKWDNVDLKNGFILLDRTKNGERREIPINDDLQTILKGITRRLDVPYVFFDNTTGKPFKDVKRSFHTAMRKAEIQKCTKCSYQKAKDKTQKVMEYCPLCKSEIKGEKGIKDFRFHDLRHTFASYLVMAGVDITTVSRLLGHKSLTMTLRYAHLAPNHLSKAVNMLNLTGEEKPTAYLQHSQAVNE